MNIYLASFFDTRERLRPIRDKLQEMGHTVVSSWIDEQETVIGLTPQQSRAAASRDLEEIKACDLLILDTLDENSRGGREVEFGYTLDSMAIAWIVGPTRNIFHSLATHHFTTWEE